MIKIQNLSKTFITKDNHFKALKNINLEIKDGEIFGIIGQSGAGKSTLVRCITMLEKPTSGNIFIDDVDITTLDENQLREKRRSISMVFQNFNLLMQKNCLENVAFPLLLEKVNKKEAYQKANELLQLVGIQDKAKAYPAQLSGGQQQRVAIARALATNPKVLLCDEATSALDNSTTNQILDLIRNINKKFNITIVIITHQINVVESICQKVAILDQGSIVEQGLVGDIFSFPKTNAASRLVFPEGNDNAAISPNKNEHYIRVVFNGSTTTNKPLIATMASEKGILANISYASTRKINDKIYGSMLLNVSGDKKIVEETITYLTENKGVTAQEVTINE